MCARVVREEFADLYVAVKRDSGASNEEIHRFFAEGMLLNVAAALEIGGKPDTWSLSGLLGQASAGHGRRLLTIATAAPFLPTYLVTTKSQPDRPGRESRVTRTRSNALWTFAITSLALFMVALDNLVVTTALPVIKADLAPRWPTSSGWSTPTR